MNNALKETQDYLADTVQECARLRALNAELVEALIDARNGYQQLFDVMPVAWQTYANIIDNAIAKAGTK